MEDPAIAMLMYAVYPLWVTAGLVDWLCHRHTDIAHTSGLPESSLHLLMFAEVGLAIGAFVLFEVNAALLFIVAGVFIAHELTVWWDLRFTVSRRKVGPFEQMVHSVLEMLPLLSLALLCVHAWPQALSLVGLGNESPDGSLHLRAHALPPGYLVPAAAAAALLNLAPFAQEWWSCWVARSGAFRGQRVRGDP